MNTAKRIYQSDERGVVHVDVPIGTPDRRVEIVIVWQDAPDERADAAAWGEDWSDLFGLLKEDPLERPAQGQHETREPME